MKLLTVQDISCYGQCSTTVALPILSAFGIETVILPSAILSTHTSGFKNFTFHDLTLEMPKIINHWESSNIKFDCLYTGYIGDARQFDYILEIKNKLLNKNSLFFVDPAMADYGELYSGLDNTIVEGMKKIASVSDYLIPNLTEACLLTSTPYKENFLDNEVDEILNKLIKLGSKNIILTGIIKNNKISNIAYNGKEKIIVTKDKEEKSYHGTGDMFSSIFIACILNNKSIKESLDFSSDFIISCIKETKDDLTHNYSVKFENVLRKLIKF